MNRIQERLFRDFHTLMGGSPETFKRIMEEESRMGNIDWSKAGERIRFQEKRADGTNPDWNFAGERWKDEADYYAEELREGEIVALTGCSQCGAISGNYCFGRGGAIHQQRRRAAGCEMLRRKGPRFTKGQNNGDQA